MNTADTDVSALLAQRADLLADACQRAQRYLAGLDARPVAPARRTWTAWTASTSRCPPPGGPGKTCSRCSTRPPRRPPWPAAGRATSAS